MSTEQERAAFEAWAASIGFCVTGKYAETIDVLCAESAFKAGYQAAQAALQSQDGEKHLVAAIREAIELLGPEAPLCSGCEYEWNHALRVLREAIDHARRAEGEA